MNSPAPAGRRRAFPRERAPAGPRWRTLWPF